MNSVFGKVSKSGRISLPAKFLKAAGIERGGDVVIELSDREIHVRSVGEAVARAQAMTRELLGENHDLTVDSFLAERRAEAAKE